MKVNLTFVKNHLKERIDSEFNRRQQALYSCTEVKNELTEKYFEVRKKWRELQLELETIETTLRRDGISARNGGFVSVNNTNGNQAKLDTWRRSKHAELNDFLLTLALTGEPKDAVTKFLDSLKEE